MSSRNIGIGHDSEDILHRDPSEPYKNLTRLDVSLASLIFPVLVSEASRGKTLTYQDVVKMVKERYPTHPDTQDFHHRHVGRRLGSIWMTTKHLGCPHIGSLVVNKATGECGEGIAQLVADLPAEREKVKQFDWSTVTQRAEAYSKQIMRAVEIENQTPKKLKYDEAKVDFFKYWSQVRDDQLWRGVDLSAYRDQLINDVMNGDAPATALSRLLSKLLEDGVVKTENKDGYVYIGEYQDAETEAPLFEQTKIGYTTDLEQRATALSGGVDGPLLFKMIRAWKLPAGEAYATEQFLHGKLRGYRQKGEFFTGPIESLVTAILEQKGIKEILGQQRQTPNIFPEN